MQRFRHTRPALGCRRSGELQLRQSKRLGAVSPRIDQHRSLLHPQSHRSPAHRVIIHCQERAEKHLSSAERPHSEYLFCIISFKKASLASFSSSVSSSYCRRKLSRSGWRTPTSLWLRSSSRRATSSRAFKTLTPCAPHPLYPPQFIQCIACATIALMIGPGCNPAKGF